MKHIGVSCLITLTLAANALGAEDENLVLQPASEDPAGARSVRDGTTYDEQARYDELPFFRRYLPQKNTWEVGALIGVLLPASEHNIKSRVLPQQPYNPGLNLGFRVGYYPLAFLGVEAESMMAFSSTKTSGTGANILGLRAQIIGQLPYYSLIPFVTAGAGFLSAGSRPMGYDLDPTFHYGVGVKVPLQKLLGVRFDFRDNLAQKLFAEGESGQALVHHLEFQLSATFTLGREAPAALSDTDFDGLFDHEDVCPSVGAFTNDGCPIDRDNDGVIDIVDECPLESGPQPKGCPASEIIAASPSDADEDEDGIKSPVDQCPQAPENFNGIEDEDGCPDTIPEDLLVLLGPARGIMFEAKGDRIFDTSIVTLDELARALDKYSALKIEVTGHTSTEGNAEDHQLLSVERAAHVKGALVERGIDSARIEAHGEGSDEPVADNSTEEGRAENERGDIRILSEK